MLGLIPGGVRPQIGVVAGANGSGKSSIWGVAIREEKGEYFNPDEATQLFLHHSPSLLRHEANSLAWKTGRDLLKAAIENRANFFFETTLGGRTMTGLLIKAANVGLEVRVWHVGLASLDLHLKRVRERVSRGGHAIPEDRIRVRYDSSRKNLISLLPHLTELHLYDNSVEGDPATGGRPQPQEIIHVQRGKLLYSCPPGDVPEWAKPIVAAVVKWLGVD